MLSIMHALKRLRAKMRNTMKDFLRMLKLFKILLSTWQIVQKAGCGMLLHISSYFYLLKCFSAENYSRSSLNLFPFSLLKVPLPSGGMLTPKGLQTLGLTGLGSGAGFERLHYM